MCRGDFDLRCEVLPARFCMTTISETLNLAVRELQAGNIPQAESLCRQILQGDSQHAVALHLLGVINFQAGRSDQACHYISQAVALKPDNAEARSNLGAALRVQGRVEEAVASLMEAVRLKPDYAEAYNNLGLALRDQGKLTEAAASLTQAVQLKPSFAEAHNNLGLVFRDQGKFSEAVASLMRAVQLNPGYAQAHSNLGLAFADQNLPEEAVASLERALRCKPDFAEAHHNLGLALKRQGKLSEAVASLTRAVNLKPDYAEAYNSLGLALKEQGKLDEAIDSLAHAIRLKGNYAEAHTNLGSVLTEQGKPDEAVASLRRALLCDPNLAPAHNNLGLALLEQGQLDEAAASLQQAVRRKPEYAEAHKNLGMVWLLAGNFEQGWPAYEWRLKCKEFSIPPFRQPQWDGRPLHGQTILLLAEQGLGDTLQFIRYAPLVKERGGRVLLACPAALARLLACSPGVDELVSQDSQPAFDVYAPLLSLPRIFGTTLATTPAKVPYLFADAGLVQHWQQELSPSSGSSRPNPQPSANTSLLATPGPSSRPELKIGITWRASAQSSTGHRRSFPLTQFAPLARLEGVRLFSLQKGPGTEQLGALAGQIAVTDFGDRLDKTAGPFMDTAAVIRNLDLVITPDTAVAHLAGGLGVPVWVALPFVPDWRWMLQREDSPWYPTMRLFRQTKRGDWTPVFERIADEVRRWIDADRNQATKPQ